MITFLRSLPNTLWWVTLFLAIMAFFSQIAIAVARSGSVAMQSLLAEFSVTVVLLALPVGIAWRGKQQGSVWYAVVGLVLLAAFARIFFF
jgi:hypothetical protein